MNHFRAQARERLNGALQRRGERESNAAGLRRFFRAAIALYVEDSLGCPVLATATTEAPRDQEIQRLVAETLTEAESLLRAWLTASASGNKHASPRAIAGMAALLASVWQSLSIRARAGQSASELKLAATAAVEVFEQWESEEN